MKDKVKREKEKFGAPRKDEKRNPGYRERPSNPPRTPPTPTTAPAATNAQLIYGVLPVLEALRARAGRIEKILIAENTHEKRLHELLELARENRIPFQKIPRANLSRFVDAGANHQGVIAFAAAADYDDAERLFEEIAAKQDAFAVILDGVEDPRNLGAILRTVDCAGADGVFIPERRAVGLTETVAKTAAGATEYVKIAKVTNISRLIDEMKARNIWTVGTSADAKMDYTEWDWTQKSALVLGSEGKGLHRLVAEKCDVLVKIPLHGKIESLNVSVAAGVILYEAVRQRRQKAQSKEQKTKD
jgi:23S rRNA (guanosine2251-2'-O)-methyltransferase